MSDSMANTKSKAFSSTAAHRDSNEATETQTVHKNSRQVVIQTLLKVQQGISLAALLDPLLDKVAPQDKSFVHALLLTTLRHWHATARLLDTLAKQPIDEIEVRTSIQVGMTQLLYLEVADHASIYETVEALKKLGFARASGLVNAILRKVSSNPAKYRKKCDKKHSLPNWLAKQLKQDWQNDYDQLMQALRQAAPMYLRVNQRQSTTQDYLDLLAKHQLATTDETADEAASEITDDSYSEIKASLHTLNTQMQLATANKVNSKLDSIDKLTTEAICLAQSSGVHKLPKFAEGMASVQDIHAMLAGSLVKNLVAMSASRTQQQNGIAAHTPVHVLDACTAPSGKLAHCLELFDSTEVVKVQQVKVGVDSQGNDKFIKKHLAEEDSTAYVQFTAIDSDHTRLARSEQTLARINLTNEAKLICADATRWQASREESEQFDIILLDAPCTATGVIRRHPDIGLLRQETDVAQTVELQAKILDNLWQQLKPNGYLVYATCSLLKAENTEQMQAFIERQAAGTVKEIKLSGDWGIEQSIGRQCLPFTTAVDTVDPANTTETAIEASDMNVSGDGFYYALLTKVAN